MLFTLLSIWKVHYFHNSVRNHVRETVPYPFHSNHSSLLKFELQSDMVYPIAADVVVFNGAEKNLYMHNVYTNLMEISCCLIGSLLHVLCSNILHHH